MKRKTGAVETAKTVKAGCGIRYDPDQLSEETGFDFSAASELVTPEDEQDKLHESEELESKDSAREQSHSDKKVKDDAR